MCGRGGTGMNFEELSRILRDLPFQKILDLGPTWNAAPGQQLPVILLVGDTLEMRLMHWGLFPSWLKPGEKPKGTPINARSETLTEKPMFRNLINRNRCVVPMNGLYEWKQTSKQPYYIHLRDSPIMLMAGLFDYRRDDQNELQGSYTILTTTPNDAMAHIHDRMPVILHPDDVREWLDPEIDEIGPLEHLLQPIPGDELEMYPVSTAVNNVRNNGPELLEPVAVQHTLL